MTRILRSLLFSFFVATTLADGANFQKNPELNLKEASTRREAVRLNNVGSLAFIPYWVKASDQKLAPVNWSIGYRASLHTKGITEFAAIGANESSIHAMDVAVTTGAISGKITRDDGLTPISGATVRALQGTTAIATTTTDGIGNFTLSALPAGNYTVEASAAGFGTKSQPIVTVTENGTTTVDLKLDAIISGPLSYIYDALGRLVATVGPAETTVYSYDAVGNLLSISRQASSQLSIISVVPNSGSVGQIVTIYGTGFSAVSSENTVQFNETPATIISATSTRIITTVPTLGLTGQIQISVTTGQATVSAPFTVLPASSVPSIQLAPRYVSILPGNTLQFFASITGLTGDQSLSWSVNGVVGGNSDLGTISSSGFYSSPNQPASIFTIRATSVASPAVFGQAQVGVLNPTYAQALISGSLLVFRRPPIDSAPSTVVSVRRQSVESVAPVAQVSVRRLPATESAAPMAQSVSVRRSAPDSAAPIANAVSVRRNEASTSVSPQSASISLTTGALIQSVSPASAAKGTSFTITIDGANFDAGAGLSFLTTAGAVDTAITASDITVNGNGTSITANVTISAGAALGQRIVVITTAAGHSLAVNIGPNVLEVIQ